MDSSVKSRVEGAEALRKLSNFDRRGIPVPRCRLLPGTRGGAHIHETLLTRGIGCRFSAAGVAREQSSEQPLQGNEGRKDKSDDAGEGDGKVKVMHDDQRLLQTRSGVQNLTLHRLPIRPHIGAASAAGLVEKLGPISDSLMSSVG